MSSSGFGGVCNISHIFCHSYWKIPRSLRNPGRGYWLGNTGGGLSLNASSVYQRSCWWLHTCWQHGWAQCNPQRWNRAKEWGDRAGIPSKTWLTHPSGLDSGLPAEMTAITRVQSDLAELSGSQALCSHAPKYFPETSKHLNMDWDACPLST